MGTHEIVMLFSLLLLSTRPHRLRRRTRDGEGQDEEVGAEKDARDSLCAGPLQRISPPHKLKQTSLAGYFNRSKAVAQEREETYKKDIAAARQQRKAKAATKPARAPPSEALREEARWLDNTDIKQNNKFQTEKYILPSELIIVSTQLTN